MQKAILMVNTAGLLSDRERWTEAEELYQNALAILDRQIGTDHPETLIARTSLSGMHLKAGKLALARTEIEQVLNNLQPAVPETHFISAYTQNIAAQIYCTMGKWEKGLDLAERSLASRRKLSPKGHWSIYSAEGVLGFCAMQAKQWQRANNLLQSATKGLAASRGKDHPLTALNRQRLEMVQQHLNEHTH